MPRQAFRSWTDPMGQAFPIRTGVLAAPRTLAETVERAYHPVCGQVSWTSIGSQQAYTILINSISDSAARPCARSICFAARA
jgi:hypothetical protein